MVGSVLSSRARRSRASERGSVLVEAAVITPIFLLVVFGVFEFGLTLRDYMALQSGTRAAIRTASTVGNDATSDYKILQAFKANSKALGGTAKVTKIIVFKATGPTATLAAGNACLTASVSGVCNRYVLSDLDRAASEFGCQSGEPDASWCPTSRKILLSDPPDYVGIYVEIVHKNVTGAIGSVKTYTAQDIMRLEPQRL